MMEIGVVGKPNVGKSTFFSAATLAPAEIASYPFTTIKPNRGMAYVRAKCPHIEFGLQCMPRNSKCEKGVRYVPVELIDVAGLVPDAHKGKGLGNQFLDDLRQASALIHIVDASGCTTFEGNICKVGEHNPVEDVKFLEEEIAHWIEGILERGWHKLSRQIELEGLKIEEVIHQRLTGLGATLPHVTEAVRISGVSNLFSLGKAVQKISKPIILAANKSDIVPEGNLKELQGLSGYTVIPVCAEYELALRRAMKSGLIDYELGGSEFKVLDRSRLNEKQAKALDMIASYLERFGSTGVQRCIEEATFKVLDQIVVYPVEDETHLTDKEGRVLPDAHLMRRGSNAKDLAFKVHTDLGNNFIRAINARTKRVIGADYQLQDGDVLKIVAKV